MTPFTRRGHVLAFCVLVLHDGLIHSPHAGSAFFSPSQDPESLFGSHAQNKEYSISPSLTNGHTLRTLLDGGMLARLHLGSRSARTRNTLRIKGYSDYLKVEAGPTGLQCMQKLV